MPTMPLKIFVSYSQTDKRWLDEFTTHAKPLARNGILDVWDDTKIAPGSDRLAEIQNAIANAEIAVLLVTPSFLASDFIANILLPLLAEKRVFWIAVRHSNYETTELRKFQSANNPSQPLNTFERSDRDAEWVSIFKKLSKVPTADAVPSNLSKYTKNVSSPSIFQYLLDRILPAIHRFFPKLHSILINVSKPEERDIITDYLRVLRAELKTEIQNKTFIPPTAKAVPSDVLVDQASQGPFVRPIHQVIRHIVGVEQGGDSASAQIAALNRKSRTVRNIVKALLASRDPLVLLGDPGTGKTMSLQEAAIALIDSELLRVFPVVPLYVRLGEFHMLPGVDAEDVKNYVFGATPEAIHPYIEALDRAGHRLIVIFDGMDEMSREGYIEHTEALSLFAEKRRGLTKTLFSCRTADFSPKFSHQRLVLLPFNKTQIRNYLQTYIIDFPITIENKPLTLNGLTKKLVQGKLPVDTNNPFILWLLCFQLREKGTWPKSRVDLLNYYNVRNYERKVSELPAHEALLLQSNEAFVLLGQIAYTITERNLGAEVHIDDLVTGNASERKLMMDAIRIGKRCAIIRESFEGFDHLIRFDHHRLQEYFTAYYIYHKRIEISWAHKFGAPRWQETMINLLLMGGTDGVSDPGFAGPLALELDPLQYTTPQPKSNSDDLLITTNETNGHNPLAASVVTAMSDKSEVVIALSDASETNLADRVEIGSRILRQLGKGESDVRTVLTPNLKKAVKFLIDNGSPITQVKMLRACQNYHDAGLAYALNYCLNSKIDWVRNQALTLLVNIDSIENRVNSGVVTQNGVESDVATEIAEDLAKGSFLSRLPTYFKALSSNRNNKLVWCLVVGILCFLLYLAMTVSTCALLYMTGSWISHLLGQPTWLKPKWIWFYAIIVIATVILTLKSRCHLLYQIPVGVGFSSIVFALLLPVIRSDNTSATVALLVTCFLYGVFKRVILLIGFIIQSLIVTIYLACTYYVRSKKRGIKYLYHIIWQNDLLQRLTVQLIDARNALSTLGAQIGCALIVLLGISFVGVIVFILFKCFMQIMKSEVIQYTIRCISGIIEIFSKTSRLLFSDPLNIVTVTFIIITFALLVVRVLLRRTAIVINKRFILNNLLYLWNNLLFRWNVLILIIKVNPGPIFFIIFWIILGFLGPVLGQCIQGIFIFFSKVVKMGHLPFPEPLNNVIVASIISTFALLVVRVLLRRMQHFTRYLNMVRSAIYTITTIIIVINILGFIYEKDGLAAHIILFFVLVAIVITVWLVCRKFYAMLDEFLRSKMSPYPPDTFTKESWIDELKGSNKQEQHILLSRTNYQVLNCTPIEFYELLKSVKDVIKEEPASSTYWSKRDKLEEALRQERHG